MNSPHYSVDLEQEIKLSTIRALEEDIGEGDLTATLIPANATSKATILSRESAVLCGIPWVEEAFHHLDKQVHITWHAREGEMLSANQVFCEISGNARAMLTGERTALNFLQLLSATATRTRAYADTIKDLDTTVVDTRKTIPGLRIAQKYAVRIGGGKNHRVGLYDGILIKENHIMAAGGIGPALKAAEKSAPPSLMVMIEVENIIELDAALKGGAKMVLLDNFSLTDLREAVRINQKRAQLEASGGIDLQTIRSIAETGVDRISIGSLTKDIKAIDLSMRFQIN